MIEELAAAVVKGLANSEIVRGVKCDVTVAAPIERVLELCPTAPSL
jgi:hypothetical protein